MTSVSQNMKISNNYDGLSRLRSKFWKLLSESLKKGDNTPEITLYFKASDGQYKKFAIQLTKNNPVVTDASLVLAQQISIQEMQERHKTTREFDKFKRGYDKILDAIGGKGDGVPLRQFLAFVMGPLYRNRKTNNRLNPYDECRFDVFELPEPLRDALEAESPGGTKVKLKEAMRCARAIGWLPDVNQSHTSARIGQAAASSRPEKHQANPVNLILYGPPGTGKTYQSISKAVELANPRGWKDLAEKGQNTRDIRSQLKNAYDELVAEKRIEFVTFHQNYGYEDFVEGIRPNLTKAKGGLSYELHIGVFKAIADRARESWEKAGRDADKAEQFVLVIDEINRGNISKILGELITLLEPDKRLGEDNELKVKLPVSGKVFGVPPNLHVVGTMNTADRSIALLDVALRRRFEFQEMMPQADLIETCLEDDNDLSAVTTGVFKAINERIRFLLDRDHQIGHSFFLKVKDYVALRDVFLRKVIPLLQEYFYGDWAKICLALGCPHDDEGNPSRKNDKPLIRVESVKEEKVLGMEHEDYSDRLAYEVNPEFGSGWDNAALKEAFLQVAGEKKPAVKPSASEKEPAVAAHGTEERSSADVQKS